MGETGGTLLGCCHVIYLSLGGGQAAVTALGHQRAAMDNSTLLVSAQALEGPLVAVLCWSVLWDLALPLTIGLVMFWKAAQWRKCLTPRLLESKEGGKALWVNGFVGAISLAEEERPREGKHLCEVTQLS